MAQTINTNIPSMTAQRNLTRSGNAMQTAMERLSSGLRVNSAKDDAAGLAISERMNAQVRGMGVAIRNANDGISLAQTAEGGLNEIGNMLQRMRELAVQSLNGTNDDSDRAAMNLEFEALDNEITRITEVTKFNGTSLLDNTTAVDFQVGANNGETLTITNVDIQNINQTISDLGDVADALTSIDGRIDEVTTARAEFGAAQSRFDSAISNLQIGMENTAAARGRIVDADFAVETATLTRSQILQQAGIAMVSQANQSPQSVLSLLG